MMKPTAYPTESAQRSVQCLPQGLLYALPVVSVYFLLGPMAVLQGIYATSFGVPLTTIATVLLISRLFDAVSDPVIGYLSDRYYTRRGSRKPFFITGGILFVVSSYFLYVPFDFETLTASTHVSTHYFLGWFLVFYLAFTLFEIPHLTWGGELATTPDKKNSLYGYRAAAGLFAGILFYILPLLPIFETNEITPQTLQWSVLIAGGLMLPLLYISVTTVPDRGPDNPVKTKKQNIPFRISMIISNRPFLIFLASFLLYGIGIGCWFSLLFIFIDSYLELGERFAQVSLCGMVAGFLSLSLWQKVASRLGKQVTWCSSVVLVVLGILGAGSLVPGEASFLPLLLFTLLSYTGFGAMGILAPSLLSDIIDYSTWKFQADFSATYFSLYTLVAKTNFAVGGALGLGIAGWYGFDPAATAYSEDAIFGLRFAVAWLPAPLLLLSGLLIAWMPINVRRHSIICRQLQRRTDQAPTTPMPPTIPASASRDSNTQSFINTKETYSTS